MISSGLCGEALKNLALFSVKNRPPFKATKWLRLVDLGKKNPILASEQPAGEFLLFTSLFS
jgi:hypothetical protein